jgi:hypothetical protein
MDFGAVEIVIGFLMIAFGAWGISASLWAIGSRILCGRTRGASPARRISKYL